MTATPNRRTGPPKAPVHIACVHLPALPLQLLLAMHEDEDWRSLPAGVLARIDPGAPLLWVNRRAADRSIRSGMAYHAALRLAPELRVDVVPNSTVHQAMESTLDVLDTISPQIEPHPDLPGLFWIGLDGLRQPPNQKLAQAICQSMEPLGYFVRVVLGSHRFSTFALAMTTTQRILVFESQSDEIDACRRLAVARLLTVPDPLLAEFQIRTLDDLVRLSASQVATRFGSTCQELHRQAHRCLHMDEAPLLARIDASNQPISMYCPVESPSASIEVDASEVSVTAMLFLIKRLLHGILSERALQGKEVGAIEVTMVFDGGGMQVEIIRPARPTRSVSVLLDLVRLRLEHMTIEEPLRTVAIAVQPESITPRQPPLLLSGWHRDRDRANAALARIRAELGDDAIVRAEPKAAHLPEYRFEWQHLLRLESAQPAALARPGLVRRITNEPMELPISLTRWRSMMRIHHPDSYAGLDGHELHDGRNERKNGLHGPYLVSGGWWVHERHQRYFFVEMDHDEILWVVAEGPPDTEDDQIPKIIGWVE